MNDPESKIPARKMITRTLWGGIIRFEEEDVPPDRRAFNAFGKSAVLWLEYSRELFRSARLIMDKARTENDITHMFQAPIALMLGAYALETILKMVIVAEHCDAQGLTMDSRAAKDFVTPVHNLVSLAQQANLRINAVDRKLLEELTRYSTWAGRYPIPKFFQGYEGPALAEDIHRLPRPGPHEHPKWPKLVALYAKIHSLAVKRTFGRSRTVRLKPTPRTRSR